MNKRDDQRSEGNESAPNAGPDDGSTKACTPNSLHDGADLTPYDEFLGAVDEATNNPSARALAIMADLTAWQGALPEWRKKQLALAGYRGDSDQPEKLRTLIDLCLNLAAIKSDGVFALAYAEAAKACHVSKAWAWAWLHMLESAGVLDCVSRGSWSRKRSTTYRFGPKYDHADALPF